MYTPFEIYSPFSFYGNNPYQEDRSRRLYLAAAEQEAERRRRRYQAALEEQAYLKEIERLRRQRALEEEQERKRQMQLFLYRQAELERRRREKEEEMERERERRAAVLAYEKQRKEQERQRQALRRYNLNGQDYQFIQGPDGRLYRLLLEPASLSSVVPRKRVTSKENHHKMDAIPQKIMMTEEESDDSDDEDVSMSDEAMDQMIPNLTTENDKDSDKDDDDEDEEQKINIVPSSSSTKQVPIFKHVVFNNCFNENRGTTDISQKKMMNDPDELLDAKISCTSTLKEGNNTSSVNVGTSSAKNGTTISTSTNVSSTSAGPGMVNSKKKVKSNRVSKKNKKKTKKLPSSSVLVGDVEDASDSECEDEYKDYWHTRRPEHGWIEPVEFFNLVSTAKNNKKQ